MRLFVFIIALSLMPAVFSCTDLSSDLPLDGQRHPFEISAFDQINQHRQRMGLRPLIDAQPIYEEAIRHARDLAAASTLNHNGFELRVNRIRNSMVVFGAAENVGFNFEADPASQIVNQWLTSPTHRSNIENRNFTHTALAMFQAPTGGHFFVQIFVASQ